MPWLKRTGKFLLPNKHIYTGPVQKLQSCSCSGYVPLAFFALQVKKEGSAKL